MSNLPRRSPRISHLQQERLQHRPANHSAPHLVHSFSQPSSASTSSHPSPSVDGLRPPPPPPTPQQTQPDGGAPAHGLAHQQQPQLHTHVPVPSPSGGEMDPFIGRPHSQPNPYASPAMSLGYPAQQRQQSAFSGQPPHGNAQHQFHQLHPHTNSISAEHPGAPPSINAGQLPPDFLAEAAKRAQMACLLRDFDDVTL